MLATRKLRSKGRPPGFKNPHKKPGGRPHAVNTVRMIPEDPGGKGIRLVFSWDIIETLVKMRDGKKGKLHNLNWDTLYVDILPFADMSIPGVFMRLRPFEFQPQGLKLYKPPGRHAFRLRIRAKHAWLKAGIPTQRLKTLWVREPAGLMILFNDGDMLYQNHKPLKEKPPGV